MHQSGESLRNLKLLIYAKLLISGAYRQQCVYSSPKLTVYVSKNEASVKVSLRCSVVTEVLNNHYHNKKKMDYYSNYLIRRASADKKSLYCLDDHSVKWQLRRKKIITKQTPPSRSDSGRYQGLPVWHLWQTLEQLYYVPFMRAAKYTFISWAK